MYKVNFTLTGSISLSKLPLKITSQIKNKIYWLSENTDKLSHIALKGNEFKSIFKLRMGNY